MFIPKYVYFEEEALKYPLGKDLKQKFTALNIPTCLLTHQKISTSNQGATLIIGVLRTFEFEAGTLNATYQLPLMTGCVGKCEYCFQNRNLQSPSILCVYVNVDDILKKAKHYVRVNKGEMVVLEGSTKVDPVPLEPYTHALAQTIEWVAREPSMRFCFLTKFSDIDGLLCLNHQGHTSVRFSINTDTVITSFEEGTPPLKERIEAARKMIKAGYPVGFLIAPVFIYPNWKEDYLMLIKMLKNYLPVEDIKIPITFEIIAHRFGTLKNHLFQIDEGNYLPLTEEERMYKYGFDGYGKSSYDHETMTEIKNLFEFGLSHLPVPYEIKYII